MNRYFEMSWLTIISYYLTIINHILSHHAWCQQSKPCRKPSNELILGKWSFMMQAVARSRNADGRPSRETQASISGGHQKPSIDVGFSHRNYGFCISQKTRFWVLWYGSCQGNIPACVYLHCHGTIDQSSKDLLCRVVCKDLLAWASAQSATAHASGGWYPTVLQFPLKIMGSLQ